MVKGSLFFLSNFLSILSFFSPKCRFEGVSKSYSNSIVFRRFGGYFSEIRLSAHVSRVKNMVLLSPRFRMKERIRNPLGVARRAGVQIPPSPPYFYDTLDVTGQKLASKVSYLFLWQFYEMDSSDIHTEM